MKKFILLLVSIFTVWTTLYAATGEGEGNSEKKSKKTAAEMDDPSEKSARRDDTSSPDEDKRKTKNPRKDADVETISPETAEAPYSGGASARSVVFKIIEEFNALVPIRYSSLDFKVNKSERTYDLPLMDSDVKRIQDGIRILSEIGLDHKNICTMTIHFLCVDRTVKTFNVPILFLSGTARGADIQPLAQKHHGNSLVKIGDTRLDCFDSHPNEDDRLERLMTLVHENIHLYAPDISFKVEGVEELLKGDKAIYSMFNSILEDPARRELKEKLADSSLRVKIDSLKSSSSLLTIEKSIAYNFIRDQFAHAEQAALEYFKVNRKTILDAKSIDDMLVVGVVIDIVTRLDMCKNCFKTMFLESKKHPCLIRILGLMPYSGLPRVGNRERDFPSVSLEDGYMKLYVKEGSY